MRIVITGPPSEVNPAVELARKTFVVWDVSRPFRSQSAANPKDITVYVRAQLPGGTGEKS